MATNLDVASPVLARVGERELTGADLLRALEAQQRLRRGRPSVDELADLLDDLVREELLIQRAEALGLLDTDPSLRRALVAAAQAEALRAITLPSEADMMAELKEKEPHLTGRDLELKGRQRLRQQRKDAVRRAIEARQDAFRDRFVVTFPEPAP